MGGAERGGHRLVGAGQAGGADDSGKSGALVKQGALFLAVACGLLAAVSPGAFGMGLAALLLVRAVHRRASAGEAPFLVGLVVTALLARAVILAGMSVSMVWRDQVHRSYPYEAPYLIQDSGYAAIRGWRLVDLVTNEAEFPGKPGYAFQKYGAGLHVVLYAVFFALFGYSPLVVSSINCFFGVLNALVVYSLVRALAGYQAARVAGLLVAFFPSLVLWSATNLKDSLMMLLVTLLPWAWLQWDRAGRRLALVWSAILPLLIWLLRPHFALGVIGSMGCAALFFLRRRISPRAAGWLLAVVAAGAVLSGFASSLWHHLVVRAVSYHRGVINSGGFTYTLFEPWVYDMSADVGAVGLPALLGAYALGWLHVLLEPLPWKAGYSAETLIVLPQQLLWYPLLLAAASGAAWLVRRRPAFGWLCLLHVACIGTVIVFGGGNIGTDFRMRDTLTPLLLGWSAIGLVGWRQAAPAP
jgi:hypothetical protein